jgi:hypothetical protein
MFLLASIGLNAIIIILILLKAEQASNKITWILIGSLITISIWCITLYLQIDQFTIEKDVLSYSIIATVSNVSILVGLIFLSLFWQLLARPSPNLMQIMFLSSLTFLLIGFGLTSIISGLDNNATITNQIWSIIDVLNIVIITLIIVFINKDMKYILNEDLSKDQRNQIINLRNGLLFGFSSAIPFIIIGRFIDRSFLGVFFIIVAITLFFFIRAYLIDPRVAFILPHRAFLLVIVNKGGVLKYSKRFHETSTKDDLTILVSMALSAISSMMSEFFDKPVKPKFIDFEKQKILFFTEESYFIAVFADRESILIQHAMAQTSNIINEKYQICGIEKIMDGTEILDLDPIISKTFYFIYK